MVEVTRTKCKSEFWACTRDNKLLPRLHEKRLREVNAFHNRNVTQYNRNVTQYNRNVNRNGKCVSCKHGMCENNTRQNIVPRPLICSIVIETFERAAHERAEEAHGIVVAKGRRLHFILKLLLKFLNRFGCNEVELFQSTK